MICGVGVDVLKLSRLSALEGKWDDSFFRTIFTERERAEAAQREREGGSGAALRYYAGRFALKEAVVKALNKYEVFVQFPEVETLSATSGAPLTRLVGVAKEKENEFCIHTSLSHEEGIVIAFALVESH